MRDHGRHAARDPRQEHLPAMPSLVLAPTGPNISMSAACATLGRARPAAMNSRRRYFSHQPKRFPHRRGGGRKNPRSRFRPRSNNSARSRLAVAAGDIEHIARLAQTDVRPCSARINAWPWRDRGAQMRGAGRQIGVVQVIGFDPAFRPARAATLPGSRHHH